MWVEASFVKIVQIVTVFFPFSETTTKDYSHSQDVCGMKMLTLANRYAYFESLGENVVRLVFAICLHICTTIVRSLHKAAHLG